LTIGISRNKLPIFKKVLPIPIPVKKKYCNTSAILKKYWQYCQYQYNIAILTTLFISYAVLKLLCYQHVTGMYQVQQNEQKNRVQSYLYLVKLDIKTSPNKPTRVILQSLCSSFANLKD